MLGYFDYCQSFVDIAKSKLWWVFSATSVFFVFFTSLYSLNEVRTLGNGVSL